MQNDTKNMCRICLKLVHSTNVALLNEVMREMFTLLSIKLDLDVSEHPLVCGMCSEILDEIYLFKSKCLCTEDIISAHIETNSKVNLMHILTELDNKNNFHIGEDCMSSPLIGEDIGKVVCRLCIKIPSNGNYIALGEVGEESFISSDIKIHLPETDLRITEKPIICDECHVCLKKYVSFATNCMAVEEKIKLYCDLQKINGPVDLASVRQFTEDKVLDLHTRLGKESIIKQEEGSVMVKVEKAQDAEDYISEGHFVDRSSSGLYLKNEEIEIKSECDDMSEEMDVAVPSGSCIKLGKSDSLKMEMQIMQSASEGWKYFSSDDHMARRGGLAKEFACQECTFETDKKYALTKHMVKHKDKSEVEMHKCENCEYESRYKSNVILHMVKHRNPGEEREFKCDRCPYETDLKSSLRKHNMIHKDKSEVVMYKCKNCEYETKYKSSMIRHMAKYREGRVERKFMCDKCEYKTDFKSSLRTHNLQHKDKSEVEMHKCGTCEYETKRKSHMMQHMLKHRDPKAKRKLKCDKCPFEADFMSSLRKHNRIHKDKSEVEMYKCKNCEFETRHKHNMIRHIPKHNVPKAERKLKCDKCPFETDFKSSLCKHNRLHKNNSEAEIYKCDNCEFETKHKGNIIRHMRKHCDPKAARKF